MLAIDLGSMVIYALMQMVGLAGVRTGVPFPVLARAIVACFWYGAQTSAASGVIVALLLRSPAMLEFHQSSHMLGHSTLEVICHFGVWVAQLLIIQNGMETVRKFQDWAGPGVWLAMLVLAVYLVIKADQISVKFDSLFLSILAATTFAVATLGIHVVANFVLAAFDFSNTMPKHISFKRGGFIAAMIALVLYPRAPWETNATHFVNFVGSTMGPIFGILKVDYYLIRKGVLNVDALYQEHGEFRFQNGWHVKAFVALAIGMVFSSILPTLTTLLPSWWGIYGWFFGVAIGGGTCFMLRAADR